MFYMKYLLSAVCFVLFASVAGVIVYDIYLAFELDRMLQRRERSAEDQLDGDAPPPANGGRARAEFETIEIPARPGRPQVRADGPVSC